MRKLLSILLLLSAVSPAIAQVTGVDGAPIDTSRIYGERKDSLDAAVFQSRQSGNYLSKGKDIRTEVISASGLCKLACCSLAESFENSASVTVGYSDAVTGARQIRLLGLSGSYTQMLDETRPVMRGILAPFGLSYVPGSWMESIQIAKGATSVVNGLESITGAINVEHRKPTDEKPLFINGSVMNDTKMDLNVISSVQLSDNWSTVVLGHVSGNTMAMDENGDGFVDDPKQLQLNISNRWLYQSPSGTAVRFGVKAVKDSRMGGQMMSSSPDAWMSDIHNTLVGGYLKVGKPVGEEGSVALVADYTEQKTESSFGRTTYDAAQRSAYVNLLYQNEIAEVHKFTVGISGIADLYDENLSKFVVLFDTPDDFFPNTNAYAFRGATTVANGGAYGEYTFHPDERFSIIAGLRGDWYRGEGFKPVPRLTLRYSPSESFTLRANAGRGLRASVPVSDNIGILSTNKVINGHLDEHVLEDAWIGGGNVTWYFGGSSSDYLSLDFFHTEFMEQQNVFHHPGVITVGNLSDIDGGRSFTDNIQADLALEPFTRFTVNTTFRYTLAKMSVDGLGLIERPMTSRYKGVLNVQYATNLNKWIFDATASLNGPCNVYPFMRELADAEGRLLYPDGKTPAYPLLYLQVTKRMKGLDIYAGCENLNAFRQKNVIIADPSSMHFDASQIWGPIMGAKFYAGFRFTIWKTEK